MRTRTMLPPILLLTASALSCGPVGAHDAYVDAGLAVFHGHPESGSEPYPPEKVVALLAWDAAGMALEVTPRHAAGTTRVDAAAAPAVVAVTFDNGLFARTPAAGRFVPGGRDVHADATEVRRFVKYGKSVFGPSAQALRAVGALLEIVPVAWPDAQDERIALAVRFDGQPLAGALVLATGDADAAPVATDADGIAVVPWVSDRERLYTTRHETPGRDGVDRVGHAAALLLLPAP